MDINYEQIKDDHLNRKHETEDCSDCELCSARRNGQAGEDISIDVGEEVRLKDLPM